MEEQKSPMTDHNALLWQVLREALQDTLIQKVLHDVRNEAKPKPNPDGTVCSMLLTRGIPPKLKGYGFLREAVQLEAQEPGQTSTKGLYCAVAARCNATASQVERGIRTAIGIGWERGDPLRWQQYFSQCRCIRPSNGALISRLAAELNTMKGNN